MVSPSVAEVNTHSVQVSLNNSSNLFTVNLTPGQQFNLTLTIPGGGEPVEKCTLIVTSVVPINSTEGPTLILYFQIVNDSCTTPGSPTLGP